MGKTKGVILPNNTCDICGFNTKNVYIYKRHRVRCKREKTDTGPDELTKLKDTMLNSGEQPNTSNSTPLKVPDFKTSQTKDNDGESELRKNMTARVEEKSKPTYKKTYKCNQCQFTTLKSKMFLYHQIIKHKENLCIYSCMKCEYCSKVKGKIQTHMGMVHKIKIADLKEIPLEYDFKSGPPVGIKEEDVSVDLSKPTPSPTPKLIHVPRPTSSPSPKLIHVPKPSSQPSSILSSALTCAKSPSADDHIIEMNSGPGSVKYKCKYCLFNNPVKEVVASHVKTKHMNMKQFKCSQCDYTTTKKIEFIAHKAEHVNVSSDQGKILVEPTEYRCGECDYTTYSKLDYDEHKRGHDNEVMPYQCNICAFSSDSELAMVRHMSTAHIENPDGVEIIIPRAPEDDIDSSMDMDYSGGLNYSTEDSYTYLPDSVLAMDTSNFDDDLDSARSSREGTPTFMRKDQMARLLSKLTTSDGLFFCPLCGLKYKRSSDLNRHMKLKHNMRMRQYLYQMKDEEDRTGETSEERSFGVFSGCEVYVEKEADNNGDLKCKYCTYVASDPTELRQHLSIHTIESRYKCPICDKQYKYSGDIHVHLRQDHQVDPDTVQISKVPIIPNKKSSPAVFRCPSCPFSSHWKAEIDRHSKLHKESKPFKCNNCNYETHWKGDIRRHVFKHHPTLMTDGVFLEDVITIDLDKSKARHFPDSFREESPSLQDSLMLEMHGHMDDDDMMENSSTSIDDGSSSFDRTSFDRSRSATPMKESPGGPQIFKCDHCSFQTNAPSKLSAHVATHVNLKVYMCPVCGRRANWKWDIRKHIKKDHPGTPMDVVKLSRQEAEATIQKYIDTMPVVRREHHLNCEITPSKVPPKPVETEHPSTLSEMTSARKSKNYVCSACGFRSNVRGNVNRHIKSLHPGKTVDLLFIPDTINEVEDLQKAGISIPSYSTSSTATPDASEKGLLAPLNVPSSAGKTEKPYMCAECGKRCSIKADVRKHYHYIHPTLEIKILFLDEHGATLLPPEDTRNRPPSAIERATAKILTGNEDFKPFRCGEPGCGKSTNARGDIKRHYSFMHPGKKVQVISIGEDGQERIEPYEEPGSSAMLTSANPKVFGYIKPFKCSLCGHRSNWKWDLTKHMRSKHPDPNEKPFIITLSEAEARSTYKEYMAGIISPVTSAVKKLKSSMVEKEKKQREVTLKRSTYRQFKCTACPYRSNWRSDLLRHIKRKHGIARAKVQILDVEEAKQSLYEYDYKPKKNRGPFGVKKRYMSGEERRDTGRIWKCGKCNYRNKDKVVVINHLSTHGVKAYKCTVCGYATNYRSSAYRHIKGKHNSDNISLCRTAIKYIKYDILTETEIEVGRKNPSGSHALGTNEESEDVNEEDADYDATEAEPNTFIDTYRCTICNFKANWRSSVCRHIRNVHSTNDYTGLLEGTRRFFNGETKPLDIVCLSVEKKDKEPTEFRTPTPSVSSEPDVEDNSDKKHKCTICPYRTAKPNLLKFHMSCHKPQPGVVQEKCKFCPYYVVAKRLLHQHMRLHMQEMHNRQKEATLQKSATPVKKSSIFQSTTPGTVTPKKYKCNNCPYQSNSKNDILYHKQFHRQRPSCEFKCDYCDYWVTHRRLIRQHMKVHDNAPSPALSSSAHSSPTKSDITESSAIHDTVQLAMYKQRMISAKIAPSISQKPVMSPMKIACSVGNKSGYALKNGVYRKMHKCSKCPYMNLRLRNLRLHELMHGNRKSKTPLQKCPHCDYSVGSKGLLSHHLKVHQPGYMMAITDVSAPEIGINGTTHDDEEVDSDENNSDTADITMETKADTLFEIAKFKKYSCEKCPYASAKRSHYERHVSLHGSKQRCQCKYCDYSVPSNNLLAQHMKLHMSPNQNLLAVQSLSNLQLLEEVPADVALASALPPLDRKGSFSVSITHDHMDLYENSPELDIEPKKLYRCDRCPYANVRRDHLLAHLKFHMIKSELVCPYCDYSVAKQHLLTQHIRVHFCPLPELSNWLVQNGEMERMKLSKDPDISEALFVAELYRTDGCGKTQSDDESNENVKAEESVDVENKDDKVKLEENDVKEEQTKETEVTPSSASNAEPSTGSQEEKILEDENADTKADDKVDVKADDGVDDGGEKADEYICQYCDREFPSSDILVKHEMQHLIGNNYEEYMAQIQQMADISDEEEGEDVLMEDAHSDTVAPPGDGMSDGSSSPDEDENYHDEIRLIDDIPLEDEIHDDECQQYEQKENISQVDNGTIDSINDNIDDDDDEISFKIDDEISFKIDDVTNASKNEDSSVIGDENSAVIDDKGSAVISNEEQMDVEDDVAEKENVE